MPGLATGCAIISAHTTGADAFDQLVASDILTAHVIHSTDPDEITYTLEVNVAR